MSGQCCTVWFMDITWTVAPEGRGAFRCRHCSYSLTKAESRELSLTTYVPCPQCKGDLNIEDGATHGVTLSVGFDSQQFLDTKKVYESVWYHATQTDQWMGELAEGEVQAEEWVGEKVNLMVHVGTHDAAMERAEDIRRRDVRGGSTPRDMFMYEVRLKAGVDIHPTVFMDNDTVAPVYNTQCAEAGYSKDVNRYVNLFESAGSISLVVNRRVLDIVKMTAI